MSAKLTDTNSHYSEVFVPNVRKVTNAGATETPLFS